MMFRAKHGRRGLIVLAVRSKPVGFEKQYFQLLRSA